MGAVTQKVYLVYGSADGLLAVYRNKKRAIKHAESYFTEVNEHWVITSETNWSIRMESTSTNLKANIDTHELE